MAEENFNIIVKTTFLNLKNTLTGINFTLDDSINNLSVNKNQKEEFPEYLHAEISNFFSTINENSLLTKKIIKNIDLIFMDSFFDNIFMSESLFSNNNNKLINFTHLMTSRTSEINIKSLALKEQIYYLLDKSKIKNRINLESLISSHLTDIKNLSSSLNTTLKDTNDILNEIILNINAEKFEYSDFLKNSYQKRFNQESELLFKKFENGAHKILANHSFETKKIKEDYDKVLNDFNLLKETFENTKKYNDELHNKLSGYEKKLQQLAEDAHSDISHILENKITSLNQSYEEKVKVIDESYENAKTNYKIFTALVENAGIYKLTENYDKKSKEEKKQYETYRTYTGRAIGAAIGFTIFILTIPLIEYWGINPPVNTSYYTVLVRLTISLMFFVLALYFSKQASKHYECYQENHRTFLQLAALEPFMARMTPDEQKEIRKGLIPSYFNQGLDGKFAAKGDEVDMAMMFTFMDKLSNFGQNKKDTKAVDNATAETKP